MEDLGMPIWVLAVAFLLNTFKGYLPFISSLNDSKNGLDECNIRMAELAKQLRASQKEIKENMIKFDDLNKKYYMLLGSMSVIKTKLKEMGFDDITKISKSNV